MKEKKCDETRRVFTLIGVLGVTVLMLLMLVSIVGATPYAYIANSDSNTVSVIDTATDTVTATVPVGLHPYGVAASPDGTKVYVTNYGSINDDGTVSVIDTTTNNVTATVDLKTCPTNIAITPDGKKAYLTRAVYGGSIYVIDTVQNKVLTTVYAGTSPEGLVVNPEGTKVYLSDRAGNAISVVDTATNSVIKTINVGNPSSGVAISPDGTKVYVTEVLNSAVAVIDTVTDTVKSYVGVGYGPYGVAINPDGTKVYVTHYSSDSVSVIDTSTNAVEATINVGDLPYVVAVTPNGRKVYVANKNSNNVSVIDTGTNTVIDTVNVGSYPLGVAVTTVPKLIVPVANFSSNVTQGYAPLSVQFTDLSEHETLRNWDFENDGIIDSTEEAPVYVYINPGNYTVNLTASNANGTDSKLATINVTEKLVLPVANFTSNVTSGVVPLNVSFSDTSTNSPTVWKWTFGDGTNSTIQNPTHMYSKAGNYTVALTASNSAGNNTKTRTNYIKVVEKPVANFSANITSGYAPLSVQFIDLSKNVTKWKWSFGDGTNSTAKNPTHRYSKAGNYTVALTASNSAGNNTKTKTNYIKVKAVIKPIAKFTSNVTSGRAPLTVAFTDKSTNYPTSWKWTFGDGTNSTLKNSTHRYLVQGNYTVKLIVANKAGNNSTTKINYIKVAPTNTRPGS